MKHLTIMGPSLVMTIFAMAANAQENQTYDRIDLMASAALDVENDLLIATVYAEVEDNDQADAAEDVNEAIAWAADRARTVSDIEIQTMNYSTRPVYANGRRIVGWVARQSLRLESADAEVLSSLLGELQERVAIQSIGYGLSRAARNAAEETLIAEALAQFNQRAELVARELDREGFRIVRLSVGTPNGFFPRRQELATFGGADAQVAFAAPEIEAGTQALTVTINGTVELEAAR